jgi:hypothetical protein
VVFDLCDRLAFDGSSVGLNVGFTGGLSEGFGDILDDGLSISFADPKGWDSEGFALRALEEFFFSRCRYRPTNSLRHWCLPKFFCWL